MADYNDAAAARREADATVENLRAFGGRIEDMMGQGGSKDVALAVLLAGEAIAQAILAHSVWLDYVTRDERVRGQR